MFPCKSSQNIGTCSPYMKSIYIVKSAVPGACVDNQQVALRPNQVSSLKTDPPPDWFLIRAMMPSLTDIKHLKVKTFRQKTAIFHSPEQSGILQAFTAIKKKTADLTCATCGQIEIMLIPYVLSFY